MGILQRWYEMASHDTVVVDSEDINHEAQANMWGFSPSEGELSQITVEGVEEFIREIIRQRKASLNGQEMLFYCWHDFQIRQLRFSLVSRSHGRLPFGCEIQRINDISDIVEQAVAGDWLKKENIDDADDHLACDKPFLLPIFASCI